MANNLGDKIRKARKDQKLTLDGLADIARLSKSYLWELENPKESKKSSPSAEKLQAIADALRLPLSYFLENDTVEPDERHLDEAFFRGYQKLESSDKEQLRKILDAFKKE